MYNKKMREAFFILMGLILLPGAVLAQEFNAGFVQGLWYSKTPFFAADTVRIYAAVQNNSGFDIQGTIEFVIDGKTLKQASFSAIQGRIAEVWTDWGVPGGTHTVEARIKEAFQLEVGKEPVSIVLTSTQLAESQVFVDEDTDKDGVGDQQDTDDDNDQISDEQEQELGTNPLEKDTDKDGLDDRKEIELGTDPTNSDTDKDGINDGAEVSGGTNPLSLPPAKTTEVETTLENVARNIEQAVNKTAETLVENLKTKKEELDLKQSANQKITEQGYTMLLATAISALSHWKVTLLLFSMFLVVMWVRRSSKRKFTEKG